MHDPAMIPLPLGEFKVYARLGLGDIYVMYWNDFLQEWEDETAIEIFFDGGSTDINGCFGNVETAVYRDESTIVEVMFAKADDGPPCFSIAGILYARHDN
jgi:hypothetical protein